MNRVLVSLWLIGAVLYAGNGFTSPRPQCHTQGTEVILSVSAPPSTKVQTSSNQKAKGFDVIELLVPKDVGATGSID
jgi:hypothetical protein